MYLFLAPRAQNGGGQGQGPARAAILGPGGRKSTRQLLQLLQLLQVSQ